MARHSPEGYLFSGAAMFIVGSVMLVRGLRKPRHDEIITGTVLNTRAHEGDFKVLVSWVDKKGLEKQSHVVVSSSDIPTKGTTLQLIASRSGRGEVEVARLKYRIGPALGAMLMGAVGIAMGIGMRE